MNKFNFYKFNIGEEVKIKGEDEIGFITNKSFPFCKDSGSMLPGRHYQVLLKDQSNYQVGTNHFKGKIDFRQKDLEKLTEQK